MLDLLKPFTEGLEEYDVSSSTPKAEGDTEHVDEEMLHDDELPRLPPMRGEILWQRRYQE